MTQTGGEPRVALVTGAARGIGAATVQALSDAGWCVVATDRCSDDPRLPYPMGTREELEALASDTVTTCVADTTSPSDLAVAVALAALVPGAVVAPPLAYGSSGEHAGFPGTLSIGQAALELVLVELVRSADAFDRVLLVNGHGGNAEPVRRAVATLRAEGRDVRAWGPSWDGDAHAGRTETSVLLALDRPVGDARPVGATGPVASLLPAMREGGVRAVSDNGVLGDARGASAEEGITLLDKASADLTAFLEQW